MKSVSLALACALLGATALAPASFAQTSTGTAQTPAEASPSTASPDAAARTGTQAQRDWRDQEGRTGGWSRSRDDDDQRYASRDMRGRYYNDDDDDDHDHHDTSDTRGASGAGSMDRGTDRGRDRGMMGQGRMNPEMMRMHMRMMGAHARGARLNLKRGDAQMDIRCPANENISACVEAVGKLMDRLQAMPQTPR